MFGAQFDSCHLLRRSDPNGVLSHPVLLEVDNGLRTGREEA